MIWPEMVGKETQVCVSNDRIPVIEISGFVVEIPSLL